MIEAIPAITEGAACAVEPVVDCNGKLCTLLKGIVCERDNAACGGNQLTIRPVSPEYHSRPVCLLVRSVIDAL